MDYYIGCSGYHYKDWKGKFYPEGTKQKEWLPYYAEHFNTVEINNSFYKTPSEKTMKDWYDQTPKDFLFTVKGNRYITHMKKLKDVSGSVHGFYESIKPLDDKAGAVLWQLPGNLHNNPEKLTAFCKQLAGDYVNVLEFRHESWFNDEIRKILDNHKVAMCSLSAPNNLPDNLEDASGNIYIRFHGKNDWYKHDYSQDELEIWQKRIRESKAGICFAYFNNDVGAHAPHNALALKEMLE